MPPPPDEPNVSSLLCDGDPLAKALAKLQPTLPPAVGADFYFRAGAASQQRRVVFWRRLTLGQSLLIALGFGGMLMPWPTSERPSIGRPTMSDPSAVFPGFLDNPPKEEAPAPRWVPPNADESTMPVDVARFTDDAPSLEERARWAVVRRDILLAGLGLAPDAGNPAPPAPLAWEGRRSPSTIFASPRKVENDPEPR